MGKVIGDASKDYRNGSGYILSGPEYYTLFDGMTGAALDTVDYEYPRGEVSKKTWGDDYGNRVDRLRWKRKLHRNTETIHELSHLLGRRSGA